MCGIAGIVGVGLGDVARARARVTAMVAAQAHRGPDGWGEWSDPSGACHLGHGRLAIIDRSPAGRQPMTSADGRWTIVWNGELYNYRELREELAEYPFSTRTDTEVVLAAWDRWGEACLDRFLGMFAFLLWDARDRRLHAVRDRFGVKPLYWAEGEPGGGLGGLGGFFFASEIKALQAAGLGLEPDAATWATYLSSGATDHSEETFWRGVRSLPPGHRMEWKDGSSRPRIIGWYSLPDRIGCEPDTRAESVVADEYRSLLTESVALRFRSDVPVGINLSGGLDSSTLLGVVQSVQGSDSEVSAFTFVTGDPAYDELPWVRQALARTRHPSVVASLSPSEVPALAESVAASQDEPFGGLPTLAYARLFEVARAAGVVVLLDGQGMDEQWAGYDYYARALQADGGSGAPVAPAALVQGTSGALTRPALLRPEIRAFARPFEPTRPFGGDVLRNLQWRDLRFTKLPRALRFSDRVSMRRGTELREPFLDHRLVELAMRQPADRKLRDGRTKWMLRQITQSLLPEGVVEAPKRPLQTPQREWLRGPLRDWATDRIELALSEGPGADWLDAPAVRQSWRDYVENGSDNSFYVWQWISLGWVPSRSPQTATVHV
jgi:asparagine synthase (glutamine-hydrolysing)